MYILYITFVCAPFAQEKDNRFKHTDKILIYYFVGRSQGKIEASSLQENIQWHIKNVKNIKAFA